MIDRMSQLSSRRLGPIYRWLPNDRNCLRWLRRAAEIVQSAAERSSSASNSGERSSLLDVIHSRRNVPQNEITTLPNSPPAPHHHH